MYGALACTAYTLLAGALLLTPWLPGALRGVGKVARHRAGRATLGIFPAALGYADHLCTRYFCARRQLPLPDAGGRDGPVDGADGRAARYRDGVRRPAGDCRRDLRRVTRTFVGSQTLRAGTIGPAIRSEQAGMNPGICKTECVVWAVDSHQFADVVGLTVSCVKTRTSIPMKQGNRMRNRNRPNCADKSTEQFRIDRTSVCMASPRPPAE